MPEKVKQPNPKLFTAPSDELVRKYGALGAIILHRICLRAQLNPEGYSKEGYKNHMLQFGIPKSTFYRTIKNLQTAGALLTNAELKEKGIPTKYNVPTIKINMKKPEKIEWTPEREHVEKEIEKEYNNSNVYPINQNKSLDEIKNDRTDNSTEPKKPNKFIIK